MIDLKDYGFTGNAQDAPGLEPARVTAVHRELWETVCAAGAAPARLKQSVYYREGAAEPFPTVGDFVLLEYNPAGESRIVRTLPRRSLFSRPDPDVAMGEQAVAANFDFVFILTSLNLDFNPKRLERYLAAAWQSGGTPVVLLTKADLTDDFSAQRREAERVAAGVDILAVSAKTGEGMAELTRFLYPGSTVVLLGSSGVGKSSLVNALATSSGGREQMAVSAIRESDSKGRHTTTHRQLLCLPGGAMVIDTPGIRELGMVDVSEGLGEAFADVEELFGRCRFSDCRHEREPGCAVQQALASGALEQSRWNSYRQLKREAGFSERKAKVRKMIQENRGTAAHHRKREEMRYGNRDE